MSGTRDYTIRYVRDDGRFEETRLYSVRVFVEHGTLRAESADGDILFAAAPHAWVGVWALDASGAALAFVAPSSPKTAASPASSPVEHTRPPQPAPETRAPSRPAVVHGETEWAPTDDEPVASDEHDDIHHDSPETCEEPSDIDVEPAPSLEPSHDEDPSIPPPLDAPSSGQPLGPWLVAKGEKCAELFEKSGPMPLDDLAVMLNISLEHADMALVQALRSKAISSALVSKPRDQAALSKFLPHFIAENSVNGVFPLYNALKKLGGNFSEIEMSQIQVWLSLHNIDGSPRT